MKNQYFGDISDLLKYALLRSLVQDDTRGPAVCWMLTANDGRTDGRHIDYLSKPHGYRDLDPVVFDALRSAITDCRREIAVVREQQLIPRAVYFEEFLTDSLADRATYFACFWRAAARCGLVFFDPDNGLDVPSTPAGRRGSAKYLYMDELAETHARGHSILVYQHFPRVSRDHYVDEVKRRIEQAVGSAPIFLTTSRVLFVLIPHADDRHDLLERISADRSRWANMIDLLE